MIPHLTGLKTRPARLPHSAGTRVSSIYVSMLIMLILSVLGPLPMAKAALEGSLVVATSDMPYDLDPAMGYNGFMAFGEIFDTLSLYQPGNPLPQPGLAQSWSVTPDGLTWSFVIRPNVKFHDGSNLDAQAVMDNFMRWWDPANPYHNGDFSTFYSFFQYKGEPGALLAGVSISGSDTVILQLSSPKSMLPSILGNTSFSIASPAAFGSLSTNPIGSGPFIFQSWVPGASILMVKNPIYWGHVPYLDTLEFKFIEDPAERYAGLVANTVQVAYDMPQDFYDASQTGLDLHLTSQPTPNIGYLGMNRAHAPLDNLLVRQAIAHAINKQQLILDSYNPVDIVATQILPPEMQGYDPGIVDYDYNPTLAMDLLDQAGYPDGFDIALEYRDIPRPYLRQPTPVAWAIKSDLAAVGINVTVSPLESSAFLNKVFAGESDFFLLGWGADYPHPDNMFSFLCSEFPIAFGEKDTVLCDGLTAAANVTDIPTQTAMYQAANLRVHDTLPFAPLAHGRAIIITRSEIAGLEVATFGGDPYENVYYTGGPNAVILPDEPSTLSVDAGNIPTTTIDIPAEAVSSPVTLAYSLADTANLPDGQASAGPGFDLTAYQDGAMLAALTFDQPVEITLAYKELAWLLDENTLSLKVQDGDQWVAAASTCAEPQPDVLNLENKTITATTCRTGRFILSGTQILFPIFIPVVSR
jgi:peptide/nickel transport system substrate-binding protein